MSTRSRGRTHAQRAQAEPSPPDDGVAPNSDGAGDDRPNTQRARPQSLASPRAGATTTSIRFDPDLYQALHEVSQMTGKTKAALVDEGLRLLFDRMGYIARN
jgi:hypothetical protein